MEGQIAFATLLTKFPRLALAPGADIRWRPNLGLRGVTELMVVAS
jgi:cytochrome P450